MSLETDSGVFQGEHRATSTGLLDDFLRVLAECLEADVEFLGELALAQQLDGGVEVLYEAKLDEDDVVDGSTILKRGLLEILDVDGLVLDAAMVDEAVLGDPSVEGKLSAFESDRNLRALSGTLTLLTSGRGLSKAGTDAESHSLGEVAGTLGNLEIVQIHGEASLLLLAGAEGLAIALGEDFLVGLQLTEAFDRGLDGVGLGPGAVDLGVDVLDAGQLEDGTDGTTGNQAGTFGSGLEEDLGGTELSDDGMGDGVVLGDLHLVEVLAGSGQGLLDGLGDFRGLAKAIAELALAVTDDDQGREAHPLSALDGLADAGDLDDLLLVELLLGTEGSAASVVVAALTTSPVVEGTPAGAFLAGGFGLGLGRGSGILNFFFHCHCLLEDQASLAASFGKSLDLSVILISGTVEDNFLDVEFESLLGERLADSLGSGDVGGILQAKLGGGSGAQGLVGGIVDDGGIDELVGTIDGDSRTLGRAADLGTDTDVTMLSLGVPVKRCIHFPLSPLLSAGRLLGRGRLTQDDDFTLVADALAVIALGLPGIADEGSHLADLLLVDAGDGDVGLLDGDFDAIDRRDHVLVGMAHVEDDILSTHLAPVADALDLEDLGEAVGDTLDHAGDEGAGRSVEHLHRNGVIRTLDEELVTVLLVAHVGIEDLAELSLGSLDCYLVTLDRDGDASGDNNRFPSDS